MDMRTLRLILLYFAAQSEASAAPGCVNSEGSTYCQ